MARARHRAADHTARTIDKGPLYLPNIGSGKRVKYSLESSCVLDRAEMLKQSDRRFGETHSLRKVANHGCSSNIKQYIYI